jgi:hypothetical protein
VICAPGLDPRLRAIYGIVPDGARNTRVTYDDGSSEPLKVSDNVYSMRVPASSRMPRTVEWDADDGAHSASTQIPADAGRVRCARHPAP